MTRASISDRAALAARQVLVLVSLTSVLAGALSAVVVADRHARVLRLEGQAGLHAAAALIAWAADMPDSPEAQLPVGEMLAEQSDGAARSVTNVYRYFDTRILLGTAGPLQGAAVATRR